MGAAVRPGADARTRPSAGGLDSWRAGVGGSPRASEAGGGGGGAVSIRIRGCGPPAQLVSSSAAGSGLGQPQDVRVSPLNTGPIPAAIIAPFTGVRETFF